MWIAIEEERKKDEHEEYSASSIHRFHDLFEGGDAGPIFNEHEFGGEIDSGYIENQRHRLDAQGSIL